MSQKVSLRHSDYNTIISWFERLFGKGKDPRDTDKFTYQKIVVMAWAFSEEMKDVADAYMGEKQ